MKSIPIIAIISICLVLIFAIYRFSPDKEVRVIEKVVEVKEVEKIVEVEKADETWKEIEELTKFETALIIGTILLFGLIYAGYKL